MVLFGTVVDEEGACRQLLNRPWESPAPMEAIGCVVV